MSFTLNNSLPLLPEAAYLYYQLSHPSIHVPTHLHKEIARLPMEEVYKPVFRVRPSSNYVDISQVHPFFASSSSSGQEWQSENDLPYRRMMIAEITRVLNLRNKGRFASPELLRKFPRMVKQLELSLYKSAPSLEAYLDSTTLPWRLQKTKKEKIGFRTHRN